MNRLNLLSSLKPLPAMLRLIGVVQLFFGLMFIAAPGAFPAMVGLDEAPDWANWLFAMMGARFLGYAVGMFVAARDPQRHRAWITTMIGIQAIDWIFTLIHLLDGSLKLTQVTTAAFLPVIFILFLVMYFPREEQSRASA